MRIFPLFAVVVAVLSLCGCASWVTVASEPAGAKITINGHDFGTTPNTFQIRSSTFGTYHIHLKKEGYEPVDATMLKQVFVGRLVLEIIYFWPAALITAAGPKASPYQHHYVLKPLG